MSRDPRGRNIRKEELDEKREEWPGRGEIVRRSKLKIDREGPRKKATGGNETNNNRERTGGRLRLSGQVRRAEFTCTARAKRKKGLKANGWRSTNEKKTKQHLKGRTRSTVIPLGGKGKGGVVSPVYPSSLLSLLSFIFFVCPLSHSGSSEETPAKLKIKKEEV